MNGAKNLPTSNIKRPNQPSLRVGLLVNTLTQQQWIYKIVADIQASKIAEIVVIVKNAAGTTNPFSDEGLSQKIIRNRKYLLGMAYLGLERRIIKPRLNALALKDISPLIERIPIIEVSPLQKESVDYFNDADTAAIQEYELDVILRFGFRSLRGSILSAAKHGVWSYHHGDIHINCGVPLGTWEVLKGFSTTGSILQILTEEPDSGQTIFKTDTRTDPYSPLRSANNCYWASVNSVMYSLRELYESGAEALNREERADVYAPYYNPLYTMPTNRQVLRGGARIFGKALDEQIKNSLSLKQWCLAYQITSDTFEKVPALFEFKTLIPPKDRFWADPFPIVHEARHFIFVEEYLYRTGKAHLAVMEVDRNGICQPPTIILDKVYHLSYPFIFKWAGDYFMIPESSGNKSIDLYRCVSFPFEWKLETTLMSDIDASDTTLIEIDDKWWMFTAIGTYGLRFPEELHLFYADSPFGPWKAHRGNPVNTNVRSARPAGNLYRWRGDLYRPGQDSSKRYGYAMSINKVDQIDPYTYRESIVSRIQPDWMPNIIATHTLNSNSGLTVVDALRRTPKYW